MDVDNLVITADDRHVNSIMTIRETATVLGVSERRVRESVRNGNIPSLTIGKRRVVPREALERQLAGEEVASAKG